MRNNINADLWLSRIGLGLIFCYCILASIFFSYFAQIHLTLPFFPFPIFIGEILLLICMVLFLSVSKDAKLFNRRSTVLLSFYFGWVLLKALINYYYDGPLTCRNAALFYYPIFAVFTYCFYQKAKISLAMLMFFALFAAGIMFLKLMDAWYWWTYVSLFIIAVWNTKSVKWRWIGWIFLTIIILLGKEYLYKGPRAHFVSILGAVVFLVFYFGSLLVKRREYFRLSILCGSLFFFTFGFLIFSDRDAIHSVTSFKETINLYQTFEREYQERLAAFVPENLSTHLYNPKKFIEKSSPLSFITAQPAIPALKTSKVLAADGTIPEHSLARPVVPTASRNIKNFNWKDNAISREIFCSRIREGRSLDLDESNIVFRFFVWRDMLRELIHERAWWGFSFGHPQRSKSLEVLDWAKSEWGRDGWITPHNSFFHIIYRAGILGIFLIGVLIHMIYKLVRDFLDLNSFEGGFLVGALVYWLLLSNFFVILEFPYNAIVFWTLFGITCAYRDGLKNIKGAYETKR